MQITPAVFPRAAYAPSRAAGSRPAPVDRVELQGAPPPEWRAMLGTSFQATRAVCARVLFGPVGHAVGKGLKAAGLTPKPFVLELPPDALGELDDANVERPVLLVHGWHHRKEIFEPLTNKLTAEGANGARVGYLRAGQWFEDADCTRPLDQPSSDMRVFVSMFTTYRDAPDQAAPELKQNLDAIRGLTGHSLVDVAAHSMGGLCTRHLVDTCAAHGIGKLMMIGTPNQGVGMASLTESALDGQDRGYDLGWLLDVKDVTSDDRRALEWLVPGSSLRQDMNSRWAQQMSSLEAVMIVGSEDKITPSNLLLPTWGDALIASSSLALEGLEVKMVSRKGLYSVHGNLLCHPETYDTMRGFFGWV